MTITSVTQTNTPPNTTSTNAAFDDSTEAAKRLDGNYSGKGNRRVSLKELKYSITSAQDDRSPDYLSEREAKRWFCNMRGIDETKMTDMQMAQFAKFWDTYKVDSAINVNVLVSLSKQFIQGNSKNRLAKEYTAGEFSQFYNTMLNPEVEVEDKVVDKNPALDCKPQVADTSTRLGRVGFTSAQTTAIKNEIQLFINYERKVTALEIAKAVKGLAEVVLKSYNRPATNKN